MTSQILPSTSTDSRASSIDGTYSGRYKISSSKDVNKSVTTSSRHTSPIIVELGSSSIKVGIAGEAQPRCIFQSNSVVESNLSKGSYSSSFIATPPLPYSSIIHHHDTSVKNEVPDTSNAQNEINQYHHHLSPFFHSLFTYRLHLKPKSRRVIVLMPIHYPQSYMVSIQSILLDELKIPALKFVHGSGLYTTIPYALGKNIGLVIDFGLAECQMGGFFNRDVLNDTITNAPVGKQTLIQLVCNDLVAIKKDTEKGDEQIAKEWNMENITPIIEDILMKNQSGLHRGHSDIIHNGMPLEDVTAITKEYIEDLYFNIDNPHSLIYTFLVCLLKCPIDLRLGIVQNVCFIGDGISFVPDLEYRFLSSIQRLFERTDAVGINENRSIGIYKVKNMRYQKFQPLAAILMEKGPLSLIHPLPYDPSCISWVGGSVYGSLNVSDDNWIHVDNTQA